MKTNNSFKMYLYALGVILVGLALSRPKSSDDRFIDTVRTTLPKTVMVQVIMEEPLISVMIGDIELYRSTETVRRRYAGAGVFVSPNGHIMTVAHLFNHGKLVSATVKTFDGYEQAGELLEISEDSDLALVKIETHGFDVDYAKIADPRTLRVGESVVCIGNPLLLEWSVSHGIISNLNRDFPESYNMTQSDAFINPGNSGGPLFNLKGELIGINSFLIPPVNAPVFTGLGFSVQSGQIIEFLTKVRNKTRGLEKAVN